MIIQLHVSALNGNELWCLPPLPRKTQIDAANGDYSKTSILYMRSYRYICCLETL
ncbi:hypothetical protein BX600DRAFT_472864 [Xylariales sp. PMI_506]|nr:hypothetical protein BX600DRAFT_472864 [Xylariales sp. PMI_506]